MKVTHVRAPKDGELKPYLTNGKSYRLMDFYADSALICFAFLGDNGRTVIANAKNCGHLNGGNWHLIVEHEVKV